MSNTSSLFPDPLRLRILSPDGGLSIGQIELFDICVQINDLCWTELLEIKLFDISVQINDLCWTELLEIELFDICVQINDLCCTELFEIELFDHLNVWEQMTGV